MQLAVITSKAERNAIVHGLPAWFVEGCMQEAKRAASNTLLKGMTIEQARDLMIQKFGQLGKKQADLERIMGKPKGGWSPMDVVDLKSTYEAIKAKEVTLEEVFATFDDDTPPKQKTAEPPGHTRRARESLTNEKPETRPETANSAMSCDDAIAALKEVESTADLDALLPALPVLENAVEKAALEAALANARKRIG